MSKPQTPLSRPTMLATLLSSLSLLGGCAGHWNYQQARDLLAQQQDDAALPRLAAAVASDPSNSAFRTAFLMTRQKVVEGHLDQARRAYAAGEREQAERHYRLALLANPASPEAQSGIAALARDARHADVLARAEADLVAQRPEAARTALAGVLEENPANELARRLLRRLQAQTESRAAEPLAAAGSKPLSLEVQGASLRQVFEIIGRNAGVNLLFDKDVKLDQPVSISLKNSTVEAALRYVLLTQQLEQQVMDANTVLVFPASAAKIKDYQQTVVRSFVLSNASAKPVAEMLKTMLKPRDLVVDDKLNMIVVRDNAATVKLAERLVSLQDLPEPEVMLDVEILEVGRNRLTELGVTWPSSVTLTPLAGNSGVLTLADLRALTRSQVGVGVDPGKLNARGTDGDTNLLANPRIRVINREKAKIVIGNKVPSITTSVIATGIVSENANYLDVGLKLEVEPTVYVNNEVGIRMSLEVSNIVGTQTTKQGTVTYTIGTRSATTVLRLKDGENQVLAGLISDEDRRTASKIPFLGDLPLAGRLFGSTTDDGKKTEIVLSITPRLIRNLPRPDHGVSAFAAGAESPAARSAPAPALGGTPPTPAAAP